MAEAYKYLGIQQADSIKNEQMKDITRKEYKKHLQAILKSKLNGNNQIKAINTYASSVIHYTAGIIDWTMEELREFDQMTRRQMNIYKSLHPRSDIGRLYAPRMKGGRGLRSQEDLVLIEKTSLAEYVNNSQEPTLHKLKSEGIVQDSVSTKQKKEDREKDREDKWGRKTLHGK